MQSRRGDCIVNREQTAIPEDIAHLQQRLDQWRSTNRPRTRLPEQFWNEAVELARQYGLYRTSHPLRLDYADLKQRLLGARRRRGRRPRKTTKPAFVELLASHATPSDECVVELESSRGNKMRIHWKGTMDWAALLRAWREAQG
jgi:hypothetical protein